MNNSEEDNDNRPFSPNINKRPNKGRSHSIRPNEHTGISKFLHENPHQNYAHIIEDKEEPEAKNDFPMFEIRGYGTGRQFFQKVLPNGLKLPWKEYRGPVNARQSRYSRQPSYSRQSRKQSHSIRPSHPRPLGHDGGRRSTHKHKRKNKHTRRRRVQRRRA